MLSLPLNFLLFGIDKLVFYWYPTRMVKGAPDDFQNAGRQMLFVLLKMLLLGGGLTLVGVAVIPGAMLQSPLLAVIPAAVVLLAECSRLGPAADLRLSPLRSERRYAYVTWPTPDFDFVDPLSLMPA